VNRTFWPSIGLSGLPQAEMNPEITVPFSLNQPESGYSEPRLLNEPSNRPRDLFKTENRTI
jgi:hypothetical protein